MASGAVVSGLTSIDREATVTSTATATKVPQGPPEMLRQVAIEHFTAKMAADAAGGARGRAKAARSRAALLLGGCSGYLPRAFNGVVVCSAVFGATGVLIYLAERKRVFLTVSSRQAKVEIGTLVAVRKKSIGCFYE